MWCNVQVQSTPAKGRLSGVLCSQWDSQPGAEFLGSLSCGCCVWVTVFEWVRTHQMGLSLFCIPVHLWGKMFQPKSFLVTLMCLCILFPEVRLLKLLHMQCTKFFCVLVPTWKWEQLKTWPLPWMLRVMRMTFITALKIPWSLNILSVWFLFQKSLYFFLSSVDKLVGFYKAAIVSL